MKTKKKKTQSELILDFFQANPLGLYTTNRVHRSIAGLYGSPLSSIKARMTELSDSGKLVKTSTKRKEVYKRQVHCWKLKKTQLSLF